MALDIIELVGLEPAYRVRQDEVMH